MLNSLQVSRTAHLQELEKNRRDYNAGSKHISDWLERTETLLSTRVAAMKLPLKNHVALLTEAGQQEEAVKTRFKEITNLGQQLSKESTNEAVNEILGNLKLMKERIQKVRKDLKDLTKATKALLPNVESMENGIVDLQAWLSAGEKLLESHRLENDQQTTEERLNAHRVRSLN